MTEFTDALETEVRREEWDFRDLMNDFEFVKELNKELSLKYQDFVDSLPKPEEVNFIIDKLKADIKLVQLNLANVIEPDLRDKYENQFEFLQKRLFQLNRFKGACVLLEKDDAKNKPMSYEEIMKNVD